MMDATKPHFVWESNGLGKIIASKWVNLDFGQQNWKLATIRQVHELSDLDWTKTLDELSLQFPYQGEQPS